MQRIFYAWLVPAWNWIASGVEALLWLHHRRTALETLATLEDFDALATWAALVGYHWRQDPLWGWLDYASCPWVTVARRAGDCDDAMMLAEIVAAKTPAFEARRCYLKATDGRRHAMLLLHALDDRWYVSSNLRPLSGPHDSADDAARSWYDDKTETFWINPA